MLIRKRQVISILIFIKHQIDLYTGVLAQEFAEVLPEAVTETGDVELPNGEKIDKFLVIDKVS